MRNDIPMKTRPLTWFPHLVTCFAHLCAGVAIACTMMGCPSEPEVAKDIYAPLGEPLPYASDEQRETFERGEEVAARRFAPTSGLGPHFNVTFCGACHEKPVLGGSAGRYRNFLLAGKVEEGEDGEPTQNRQARGVGGVVPSLV